jgi:putative ABC transport system substrate-binding protein
VELLTFNASSPSEIDTAFAHLVQQQPDALQVSAWPPYARVGGLMSYGTNIRDAWRQAGTYTGRILNGEKPADLPVQEVTKIELVINLKTAKALGLELPLTLQMIADEIIQ